MIIFIGIIIMIGITIVYGITRDIGEYISVNNEDEKDKDIQIYSYRHYEQKTYDGWITHPLSIICLNKTDKIPLYITIQVIYKNIHGLIITTYVNINNGSTHSSFDIDIDLKSIESIKVLSYSFQ